MIRLHVIYGINPQHFLFSLFIKDNNDNKDDLKLFAKDDNNLEEMLKLVKKFSDDIGMAFGLDKCAKYHLKEVR